MRWFLVLAMAMALFTSPALVGQGESAKSEFTKGSQALNKRDYHAAIYHFNTAITLDPNYVDAYFSRGNAHGFLKKRPEAIANYTKVIELNPNHVFAFFYRGRSYQILDKNLLAIVNCFPGGGTKGGKANYNLGIDNWGLGD